MSFFDGIEEAKTSDRNPFIEPGIYLLEVQKITAFNGKNKVPTFAAEFKVLEAQTTTGTPNAVGSTVSYVEKLTKDTALGNLKDFASGLSGRPKSSITKNDMDLLVSEKQPAKGVKVRVEAFKTPTKAGGEYTVKRWSPYENVSATAAPIQGETSSSAGKAARR